MSASTIVWLVILVALWTAAVVAAPDSRDGQDWRRHPRP